MLIHLLETLKTGYGTTVFTAQRYATQDPLFAVLDDAGRQRLHDVLRDAFQSDAHERPRRIKTLNGPILEVRPGELSVSTPHSAPQVREQIYQMPNTAFECGLLLHALIGDWTGNKKISQWQDETVIQIDNISVALKITAAHLSDAYNTLNHSDLPAPTHSRYEVLGQDHQPAERGRLIRVPARLKFHADPPWTAGPTKGTLSISPSDFGDDLYALARRVEQSGPVPLTAFSY